MTELEDIITGLYFTMRMIAFFAGMYLFGSALAEFGSVSQQELLTAFYGFPIALLKFFGGAFLIMVGVYPEAIRIIFKLGSKR